MKVKFPETNHWEKCYTKIEMQMKDLKVYACKKNRFFFLKMYAKWTQINRLLFSFSGSTDAQRSSDNLSSGAPLVAHFGTVWLVLSICIQDTVGKYLLKATLFDLWVHTTPQAVFTKQLRALSSLAAASFFLKIAQLPLGYCNHRSVTERSQPLFWPIVGLPTNIKGVVEIFSEIAVIYGSRGGLPTHLASI